MPEPTPDRPGPLDSIRVLDLTQNLAGPYCTMLLADLGADVIKVEPPRGDSTRHAGPYTDEDRERAYGAYFASVNRGKRSIVLDLKRDADRDVFLRLVPTVDVVVESQRPGVMDRLGVGYEVLAERHPKLVYAAIRGFGDPRTGASPYAAWPSYDIVAQAMGGLVSTTGARDGTVAKCGPSVGDLYTGALSTVGLLAAVIDARHSGTGQFVDVAMYDAVLSLSESAVYRYSCSGVVPGPTGNGHPQIAPFDLYPTADGTCGIGAPGPLFARLCDLMGRPELATDERFGTNPARLANRPALNVEIAAWTSARTTAAIVARLGGEVPVGPVNDMAAIWNDPHVAARGMLVAMEQPDGSRPLTVAGQPIKMTKSGTGVRRRPPRLDEHGADIRGEAGLRA